MKLRRLIFILLFLVSLTALIVLIVGKKETEKNIPSVEVTQPDASPTQKPLEEENKQSLTEPHLNHSWESQIENATCTENGATWEECECGEIQNKVLIEATGHGKEEKVVIKEPTIDTDGEFEVVCSICKEVLESGVISKKGAFSEQVPGTAGTPSKDLTPTPIPVIVNAYTNDEGNDVTVYADGSSSVVMQECNEIAIDSSHFRPIVETAEVISCKNNYDSNNNLVSREYMLRFEETTSHEDTLFYYMHYYFDCGTNKLSCRLVNADGSFNQYSEYVFNGYVREARCKYVKQRNKETGESEWKLVSISFGSDSGGNITIAPEELIYYNEGIIRLYDEG